MTDIQTNRELPKEIQEFLVDLASHPTRSLVMRNNAANALGIQAHPVPGWPDRLAEMAMDPTEDATWRDYAVQHLADQLQPRSSLPGHELVVDSVADRTRYLDLLERIAREDTAIAGTAVLHLDRLSREHGVAVDPAKLHDLLLGMVSRDTSDVGARVTALGILAIQGDVRDAKIARQLLAHSNTDVRRGALAALGYLGNADDLAQIRGTASDGDPTVEMARSAAEKRILDKMSLKAKD